MDMTRREKTWIQCTECGEIYTIDRSVSIEKMYVASVCPRCGNKRGLNCGHNKDDLYLFMNVNLDYRYYKY